jgi:hypothetical protein
MGCMSCVRGAIASLGIAVIAACLVPGPAARAEVGFLAIVEKLRAGQPLNPDETALYSAEVQRLIGKLASGQPLTLDERREVEALRQPGTALPPPPP